MRPPLLLIPAGLLLASPALARCPNDADLSTLEHDLANGLDAFTYSKLAPLTRARVESRQILGCLDVVVPTRLAAGYYRLAGLGAYVDDTGVGRDVRVFFQVARDLEPTYEFDDKVVPEVHELRDYWNDALNGTAFVEEKLPGTDHFQVFIDGRAVETFPLHRPMILQITTPAGKMRYSNVLTAEEVNDLPELLTHSTSRRWATGLGAGAIGMALASGTLWGTALALDQRYYSVTTGLPNPPIKPEQEQIVERSRRTTNAVGVAAQVGTGLTLALGATAAVLW